MSESVNLPALGESVTEGTVTRWLKNVGDRVEVDEPLLEVSTDKVDTEIPSPVAGTVEEILVAEDETVEVGTPLVRIGDGAQPAAGGSENAAPEQESASAPAESGPSESAPSASAPAESAPSESAPSESEPGEPGVESPAPSGDPLPEAEVAPQSFGSADVSTSQAAVDAPNGPERDDSADSDVEVPSTDAPAPGEESTAEPAAPAPSVDPAPTVEESSERADQPASAPGSPAPGSIEATPVESSTPASPVPDATPEPVPAVGVHTGSASVAPSDAPAAPSGVPTGSNAGYVTPLVRKLAHELGVDLSTLSGSGVGGRIRKEDVIASAEPSAPSDTAPSDTAPSDTAAAAAATDAATVRTPPVDSELRGTTVPMSRLRKVIAERAVASMQASAQLTSVVEVDVTKVAAFRDRVKAKFADAAGVKLSFLPFFALAAAEALRSYPIVNATIDGDSIVYPAHENLSIAVDSERGLLTPVIRDASELTLAQLAQQIADLAERTRDNRLKPDELAGGTFTLTNTGSRGALFDTPVVFLPQSAILGTGIVVKKPMVVSQDGVDAIAIRSAVYLALSYDHRIVDGADAARFLVAVKARLEAGEFDADLGI